MSLPSPVSSLASKEWEEGAIHGLAEWARVLDCGASMGVETTGNDVEGTEGAKARPAFDGETGVDPGKISS